MVTIWKSTFWRLAFWMSTLKRSTLRSIPQCTFYQIWGFLDRCDVIVSAFQTGKTVKVENGFDFKSWLGARCLISGFDPWISLFESLPWTTWCRSYQTQFFQFHNYFFHTNMCKFFTNSWKLEPTKFVHINICKSSLVNFKSILRNNRLKMLVKNLSCQKISVKSYKYVNGAIYKSF
jgi:hypothetical protein